MNKRISYLYRFMLWGAKVVSFEAAGNVYSFTIETDDVVFTEINRFLTPRFLTGFILFTLSPGRTKAKNL
jgi:hypothetical protein